MSQLYVKKANPLEIEPWKPGADMAHVSVSPEDTKNGSPKPGDMIATNPDNADDRWLITAAYFAKNYEAYDDAEQERNAEVESGGAA